MSRDRQGRRSLQWCRNVLVALVAVPAVVLGVLVPAGPASASVTDPCAAPTNPVVCENSKPGTPESVWDITGAGDASIQGFATDISVNVGGTVSFKVTSPAAYTMSIYRLGWYQGNGARLMTTVATTARVQPACGNGGTAAWHLVDCGNWTVTATYPVPSTAVSGVYLALLHRNDTGGESQIPFIVRNDASTSDVLYQTSDTTWQAYNNYGGDNLYGGPTYDSPNRSLKVSYNRPFSTRGWEGGRDYLFANEYPMIRFLEHNGYDVSYFSGIDTARLGSLITKHKTFVTVGHDEYWSGEARANVTAARNAGVNLAFFSGNDNYWKTRWENSTDGSSTPYRTLVCYKETWANSKIDPSAQWTGTWRDPRFSPPSDGGNPENALGGTLYMSNNTDLPIQVNTTEGRMRIWRGTTLSTLAAGQTVSLSAHTVGYESNEDLDNGFRPAGLIDMSTTTGSTPQRLQDFGTLTLPGTTTHHITLYKAPSGALVFSAGTIQWAWGLDDDHDGGASTIDPRMQQATVNLLADMSAQPLTIITGLSASPASSDHTAPTSTVTTPTAGQTVPNGTVITATGSATDAGGGVVGGVEVSADGGSTWHPAIGRASWSYTFVSHGSGALAIRSRATDDSGNTETPGAGVTINQTCPCSLFGNAVPGTTDAGDVSNTELGVRFTPTVSGFVNGIRFYKSTSNTGPHTGTLWSSTGTALATGTFSGETATGWQSLTFTTPVAVTAGTTYVASYLAPHGGYSADSSFFTVADWRAGPLTALRAIGTSLNGVYKDGGGFPAASFGDANYYVDVNFSTSSQVPPTVSWSTPRSGQVGVAVGSVVKARFASAVTTGSAVVSVKTGAGVAIAGTTTYDAATTTVSFTPSLPLTPSTSYSVTVSGALSPSGVVMAPLVSSFTTDTVASCPCSVFGTAAVPTVSDSGDASATELGVRFLPSTSGFVSGVRFYKASANTGTHTGTLWSSTGTALATGTFTGESATGWQTLTFASPVAVTAGTTYVASYHTATGHYAADANALATDYVSGAVTLPAAGGNGVYVYGTGGVAPTNTFGATNYWVDPIYQTSISAPTVTATSPASGATGVSSGAAVTATFSVDVQSSTIVMIVTGPGGTAVAGSTAYVSAARTVTFTPSSGLSASAAYTVNVSGAKNLAGTPMAGAFTWSFTVAGAAICPCSLFPSSSSPSTVDSGDATPVELGVRVTPSAAGYITGVKFYKASTNTGTHTGTLWSSTGTALATGTFFGETASGWQTLQFPVPVLVTAGTTYTASYFAPVGHYSSNGNYFTSALTNGPLTAPATGNGVYVYGAGGTAPTSSYQASNYWVDVVFAAASTPPTVTATLPAAGAPAVAVNAPVTATFSLPMQTASLQFTLTPSGGSPVGGTLTYTAGTATAIFTPTAALAGGTAYTAQVSGTATGGAALAAPVSWTFTTVPTVTCPCSLFAAGSVPSAVDSGDTGSVELGVRFTPSRNGTVTAVKFYKAAANTGTHTGTLWSSTGTALATGTFAGESASGWQTLTFATPVNVTAGTTYTASYLAPVGHYSVNQNYFASAVTNGPLTAPSSGNGVYQYGAGGVVPTSSYLGSNYWVDVVLN